MRDFGAGRLDVNHTQQALIWYSRFKAMAVMEAGPGSGLVTSVIYNTRFTTDLKISRGAPSVGASRSSVNNLTRSEYMAPNHGPWLAGG